MPQTNRKTASPRAYTMSELIELRRQMLRFARSLPPGPRRNERRQIADSLRRLFKNKEWLESHTVEGSASFKAHRAGLPSLTCSTSLPA